MAGRLPVRAWRCSGVSEVLGSLEDVGGWTSVEVVGLVVSRAVVVGLVGLDVRAAVLGGCWAVDGCGCEAVVVHTSQKARVPVRSRK